MNPFPAARREAPSDAQARARVERIVREVMERLRRTAAANETAGTAAGPHVAGPATPSDRSPAGVPSVHLSGQVISAAIIQGLPPHIRHASLSARAVITPAARDVARERGLQLAIAPASTAHAPAAQLLVADADSPQRQAAVTHQLQRRGVASAAVAPSELVPRVLHGQAVGVLLADLPAPHVCAACRHTSIVAAAVGTTDEARAIAASMDVNLWVVDMQRLPLTRALLLLEQLAQPSLQGPWSTTERALR